MAEQTVNQTAEEAKVNDSKVSKPKAVKKSKPSSVQQSVKVKFIGHPSKGIVDSMTISLFGKAEVVPVGVKTLPIKAFTLSELTASLFNSLLPVNDKWQFAYKPVYGYAFGLIPSKAVGYKAFICQHFTAGKDSICLNANQNITLARINAVIESHKLAVTRQGTGWRLIQLTKDNLQQTIRACKELMA